MRACNIQDMSKYTKGQEADTTKLNQNWKHRVTSPTTEPGYLESLPGTDMQRQGLLDCVNTEDDSAGAQVTLIDKGPSFMILWYKTEHEDVREALNSIRKKLRDRIGYGPPRSHMQSQALA